MVIEEFKVVIWFCKFELAPDKYDKIRGLIVVEFTNNPEPVRDNNPDIDVVPAL